MASVNRGSYAAKSHGLPALRLRSGGNAIVLDSFLSERGLVILPAHQTANEIVLATSE